MKKAKILIDLKIAMNNGFCGIAKENRLVYKMLATSPQYHTTGLLISKSTDTVFSNYTQAATKAEQIAQTNQFFHEAFEHESLLKAKLLNKLKFAKLYALNKRHFNLYNIDGLFNDVIWRNVFNKSLGAEDRMTFATKSFYFSDLTTTHLRLGAYFKRTMSLNTQGHDIALFLEPAAIKVTPGTIKVVRYNDAIPITEPDFAGSLFSYGTLNTLRMCAQDAYFVCISAPARDALLAIHPELEQKTFVIPCAMSSNYQRSEDTNRLKQILLTRLSAQLVHPQELATIRAQIQQNPVPTYFFNVAAFDPRKNHLNLIRAWEELNYQYNGQFKLIIAANRGRFAQEAEDALRPHVQQGNIIHLENVAAEELPYLFSHAKAFVFPSYIEGFGLPPLEAMQCGCPTIVSDIPAHRWAMGDASLYCDPYAPQSLTNAMAQLTYLPGADDLAATLSRKGQAWVQRYAEATVAEQWSHVLADIKTLALKTE